MIKRILETIAFIAVIAAFFFVPHLVGDCLNPITSFEDHDQNWTATWAVGLMLIIGATTVIAIFVLWLTWIIKGYV